MKIEYFNLYQVLLFQAVVPSVLLACLFLLDKKFSKKVNSAAAVIFITVALTGLANIIGVSDWLETYPSLAYLPISYTIGFSLGIHYFIVWTISPNYIFRKMDYWIIAPLFILFLFNCFFYFHSLQSDYQQHIAFFTYYHFRELLSLGYLFTTIFWGLKKIKVYEVQLQDNFSDIEEKSLRWLSNMLWIAGGIGVLWAIGQFVFLIYEQSFIFYVVWASICLFIYQLGYFLILRKDLFEVRLLEHDAKRSTSKPLLSTKANEHYEKILHLMKEEKLYQNPNLNMTMLAQRVNLSSSYCSRIINQKEQKNFYEFVNFYRVEQVKVWLNDPKYSHYSILGIALEAGFKSKTTFNSVFKKMTGITPSAYKKSLKK